MERQPSWERVETVRDVACTLQGKPAVLSPQLEEIDFLPHILKPAEDRQPKFAIILNVHRLQPNEVKFSFPEENILELRAEHGKRLYCDDVSFSRFISYRWHLPKTVTHDSLQALWTFDNFLIIASTKLKVEDGEDCEMKLVPQRIWKALRPFVDLSVLTEVLEDIRDTAQHSLRFIRTNAAEIDGWDPDTFSIIADVAGPNNA